MSDELDWQRITTEQMFRDYISGRHLIGACLKFVIHADGRIDGMADGQRFSGRWVWRDGLFCRVVEVEGEQLGADCELIETSKGLMRYTRDKGAGPSAIVEIGERVSGQ